MASKSDWVADVASAIETAEDVEQHLAYHTEKSEASRKARGAYYTPADVARFFWRQFFSIEGIKSRTSALRFLSRYRLVEPSVGAGILFFTLLEALLDRGLTPQEICKIDADLVDFDKASNKHLLGEIDSLQKSWGVQFRDVTTITADFLKTDRVSSEKPTLIFGNPPFVPSLGKDGWRNVFATFLERAIEVAGVHGIVHFILPLSISFSRDYIQLRNLIGVKKVMASHYDNIPDCLFKSGKPMSENTNKANSQRCTIISLFPSNSRRVLSTKLHRWSRADRQNFFAGDPEYLDVSEFAKNQFPRPANRRIIEYLRAARNAETFDSLTSRSGRFRLYPAAVARNYIGFRPNGVGAHELVFATKTSMLKALLILSSDIFYDYWMTFGDGFHITKSDILDFPVTREVDASLEEHLQTAERLWRDRAKFQKIKLNSGSVVRSFDFRGHVPSLYDMQVPATDCVQCVA